MEDIRKEILERFITSRSCHPRNIGEGYITVSNMALNLNLEVEIAKVCISDLIKRGFLINTKKKAKDGDELFVETKELAVERENLLHLKKMRSKILLNQEHYSLKDIIVSILKDPEIENRKTPSRYSCQPETIAINEIEIYLFRYEKEDIEQAISDLIKLDYVRLTEAKIFGAKVKGASITNKGKLYYKNKISLLFGVNENLSILELNFKKNINIFLAWQSDFNSSRSKINKVIKRIETNFNKALSLIAPVKIVFATNSGDGAVRIDQYLIEKIAQSDIFIGDVTPIVKFSNKAYPNPNVLIEAGYALVHLNANQVYLLEQKRDVFDIDGDESASAIFPFDIYVAKRISFEKSDELEKKLSKDLEIALQANGLILGSS